MKKQLLILLIAGIMCLPAAQILNAQVIWDKPETNSVLGPGSSGAWDDKSIIAPSVLFDDTTYHMWYSSMEGDIFTSIGYATSPDGISWTKYDDPTTTTLALAESDPVFSPGDPGEWDDETIGFVDVILLDNIYYMWYMGSEDRSNSAPSSIGRATSMDGINWMRDTVNNPVMSPGPVGSWDDIWIAHPCVLFDGAIYHMWYNAYGGNYIEIGHATSPDGITWTKDALNPVMRVGSVGSWDNPRTEMPSVIYDGSTYQMWFTGGSFLDWRIGYATSPDGSNWTKADSLNPVLDWGESGSWDDTTVAGSSVIHEPGIYKMWYQGLDENVAGHIGYAESIIPTGINDNISTDLPRRFTLLQNYPNPFNPTTTISYEISERSVVSLTVFDILGQEIAILHDAEKPRGNYEVQWNGADQSGNQVSTGVYFARLQAGEYNQTIKMVYLR